MNYQGPTADELRCIEFVELMTEYLDDEVSSDQQSRIDRLSRRLLASDDGVGRRVDGLAGHSDCK